LAGSAACMPLVCGGIHSHMPDSIGPAAPTSQDRAVAGRRIRLQPRALLRSPGFPVGYPCIINSELLGDGLLALMANSWGRGAYEERQLEIFCLNDVYVVDECLILDRDLQVIENASDPYEDAEIEQAIGLVRGLLTTNRMQHYGCGVVSKRRAAHNFGHFLMEMIPMAVIGEAVVQDRPHWHLIHQVPPPMLDVVFRSFRLLGIPLDNLLVRGFNEAVHFDEIVIVRGLTKHGSYMSPLSVKAVEGLGEAVPPGPGRKLFVRRIPGWNRSGTLLNEEQVASRLAAKGFEVIDPGAMTLEEQISTFRGAQRVVGVIGAAMTNIVFCSPGTEVMVLAPSRFPDNFFWFIATHKGLNYTELRGEQVAASGPDSWKADFAVTEEDIQYLENLGCVPEPLAMPELPFTAHVQNVGDVTGLLTDWVGTPGSQRWIEGFSIAGCEDIPSEAIEYRAVLGENWFSPWMPGRTFCGTHGWKLPLFGFAMRFAGSTAERYDCSYTATFVDGSARTDVAAGEPCASDSLAPLEAFQIALRRRGG
jgi:capsular polysaccharide biosynthesis protein